MSLSSPLKSPTYPGLLSIPRLTTLFASLLVSLSSGSNYVYSAYAPQLGARLQITHTQLNILGLAGNIGVYSSGPYWGRIVDSRGPRILLVCAFLLLLTGYLGILYIFNSGVPSGATTISTFTFCLLVLCGYMTGSGGNGGLTSSVNSTAKTFPDKARGSATGIVISGFGLSAFLFSTISHIAFAGNTSSFLRLLAFGTALPMVLGFFLVRPIPLPPVEEHGRVHGVEDGEGDEEEGLLNEEGDVDGEGFGDSSALGVVPLTAAPVPVPVLSRRAALNQGLLPNVYGKKLFYSSDFWLLCSILSLLSGTGLMYINNVGSMAQALYFSGRNKGTDPIEAAGWQASQVSTLSLMNFSGRIFIGLVSDTFKNRLSFPRSYCLVIVSLFFLVSQVVASNVDDIHHLWIASALLGLAHGSTFSLFPTVCIEWFGLPHFSENWGYLSMSPMFAGNFFSVAFGRNLDAHDHKVSSNSSISDSPKGWAAANDTVASIARRVSLPSSGTSAPLSYIRAQLEAGMGKGKGGEMVVVLAAPKCDQGRLCYVNSLYITVAACLLALGLSLWAGWRDRRKLRAAAEKVGGGKRVGTEGAGER